MAVLFGMVGTVIARARATPRSARYCAAGWPRRRWSPRCWPGRWAPGPGAIGSEPTARKRCNSARLWLWFLWPAWPLALWTLWRWRRHLAQPPHVALPLALAAVSLVACVAGGGFDRALMLGLPAFAVLAPLRCRRCSAARRRPSTGSRCSSSRSPRWPIWVIYVAMQTGVPGEAGRQRRQAGAGLPSPVLGAARSRWRSPARWPGWRWCAGAPAATAHALWKSLVLPAGGVALCWLLLMTLWLPLLDYARSNRPWVERAGAACAGRRLHRRAGLLAVGRWPRWSNTAAGVSMARRRTHVGACAGADCCQEQPRAALSRARRAAGTRSLVCAGRPTAMK